MFENFKLISRLFLLQPQAMTEIAQKESATIDGILITFIGSLASAFGVRQLMLTGKLPEIKFDFTPENFLTIAFLGTIVSLSFIIFSSTIARLLGGKSQLKFYFRVLAFSNVINLINLFPPLSFLNLWFLLAQYKILRTIHRLSSFHAMLTILATFLSIFALFSMVR